MVKFTEILILLLCSVPTQVLCLSSCNFPAIFNFGDSNSDTGGLSAAFGQAPYPHGETFFHAPAGRFSDGRLVIDFFAEALDLPYLSAFLDSIGSNFSHGANFATAGSTIRPQNTTMAQSGYSPISLDVQGVQFSDFHSRSQIIRQKGTHFSEQSSSRVYINMALSCHRLKVLFFCTGNIFGQLLPKEEDFSQALYTFDIGQNDLTAGYKLNMSTEQVKAYVPDLLSQLSNVVKKIYAKGGRSFWIHNTGPVGCLPYVMDRFFITAAQIDKYGCANPFNEVAKYFNLQLKETVAQLRKELPLAAITYVDVYFVKYSLIGHAKKLGFENPFLACCGHGGKYNYNRFIKCGSKKVVNGKEVVIAQSCKDPSVRVSWDGTHFTEAANKWIFDQIVNGSFSDPPIPLSLACNRVNH
ncbi:GDSL esterase/lipase At3g26430-like isoform X1 [Lycium ferocissimum]|uniref:GDSL esterase/lipase At3g26430-like isoform X1 n=1 Tax=Lycium ferocissimum TaxID=112874 RepID=UPI00281570F5|nr:GDSL esterase/lipase At3g26430-like isoform X1 [Lycium ferocissimum]